MHKKIRLILLTGFLGSGKSTWLAKLLKEEKQKGSKVAVLMNELGDYSVDTTLVGDDVPLQELLKGCICCTLKDEVEIQLINLVMMHEPDVIFIESTGVAHPMEIIDACMSPLIVQKLDLVGVYHAVDAERWANREKLPRPIRHLLEDQVRYADELLLNKIDTVSKEEREAISLELRALNQTARYYESSFAEILHMPAPRRMTVVEERMDTFHVKKELGIKSLAYTFSSSISRKAFEEWLKNVPDSVLRVKGFVQYEDQNGPTLVQVAYGVANYVEQEIRFPTTLIVIGHHLEKQEIIDSLEMLERAAS